MSKITRRHFLISGGAALGACFLPAWLLRRLRDHQLDTNEVLIEGPVHVENTLYARKLDDKRWQLALGLPTTELRTPTWREWLTEHENVDPRDRKGLARWIWANRGTVNGPSRDWIDHEIPFDLWLGYLEGQFAVHDSPEAQALHYLDRIELAHGPLLANHGGDVGTLHFWYGTMPGLNWHFVQAEGELILPALQHRLRELGEDTLIEVCDCL